MDPVPPHKRAEAARAAAALAAASSTPSIPLTPTSSAAPVASASAGAQAQPSSFTPSATAPSSATSITVPITLKPADSGNIPPSLYSETFPKNIVQGTQGAPINARVNYFPVTLPNVDKVFVYEFTITSDSGTITREIKNAAFKKDLIVELLRQNPPVQPITDLATDYNTTMVFLVDVDPVAPKTVTLPAQGTTAPSSFKVSFERKHILVKAELIRYLNGNNESFDCSIWLTALNILSRNIVTPETVKVGRDKFFPLVPEKALPLLHGLHARLGYFTSMRPVDGQIVMNTHAVSGAFIDEQRLIEFPVEFIRGFELTSSVPQLRALDSKFRGLTRGLRVRFLYTPAHPGGSQILTSPAPGSKIKRINGFGSSAATHEFHSEQYGDPKTKKITVRKYFDEHVLAPGVKLDHPDLLVCDVGTKDRPCYVPSELLYIVPHQPFLAKLPEKSVTAMIKVAQRLPLKNVELIEDTFKAGHMFDHQKLQNSQPSGLSIVPGMMDVNARALAIPALLYNGTGKHIGTAKDGGKLRTGRWDIKDKKFKVSGKMGALGVIEIGKALVPQPNYKELSANLTKYGITGTHHIATIDSATASLADLDKALDNLNRNDHFKQPGQKFILIMLPNKDAEVYERIKWWADTQSAVHTISVTPEKRKNIGNSQFDGNLALKFNAKAGGRNHTLETAELKFLHGENATMVVGADVTHPGPGSVPHCPSIAAVVASDDTSAVNYPGSLRLQRSKQEMIAELDTMVLERLKVWFEKNRKAPSQILFYRDGVSESQFAMVKDKELPLIVEACKQFGADHGKTYTPKITLVVCGKRHHTRFYPTEEKQKNSWVRTCLFTYRKFSANFFQMIDTNKNFRPGLVVDDPSIRNPYHFDFYLQSHAALQGTARPCHYFVISNGMNFSVDRLQKVTFNLCWTFARALTPISLASPAYYADLLAERGRCYIAPLINPVHPARPDEATLLAGFQLNRTSGVDPMRQKDIYVLGEMQHNMVSMVGADEPHWVSTNQRQSPQMDAITGNMFYI